jgi:hypothetical protein
MLLLIQVINVFPQNREISFYSGLKLGNLEVGKPTSQFDDKFKVSLLRGGNRETQVPPRLTYQSELHYTVFGSVHVTEDQYERYRSNYLLVPVMVRYNMDNGMSLLCGPQPGFLLKAKSIHDQHKYNIRDDMKKLDFLYVVGVEFKTQSGIHLGMRYQWIEKCWSDCWEVIQEQGIQSERDICAWRQLATNHERNFQSSGYIEDLPGTRVYLLSGSIKRCLHKFYLIANHPSTVQREHLGVVIDYFHL